MVASSTSAPTTADLVSVFRQAAEFRAGLPPAERDAFDRLMRIGVQTIRQTPDVEGYGLRAWLAEALQELVRFLAEPYEGKHDGHLAAMTSTWAVS